MADCQFNRALEAVWRVPGGDQRIRRLPRALEDPQGRGRRLGAAPPGALGRGGGRAALGRDALAVSPGDEPEDLRVLRHGGEGPARGRPRLGAASPSRARCPRRRRSSRARRGGLLQGEGHDDDDRRHGEPRRGSRPTTASRSRTSRGSGCGRPGSSPPSACPSRTSSCGSRSISATSSARSSPGIAAQYEPEALVGRNVVVVANLKPAKLMGVESNGMVLAASVGEAGAPVLLDVPADVPAGEQGQVACSPTPTATCRWRRGAGRPARERARGGRRRGSWSRARRSRTREAAAALADPTSGVFAAVGVHPHEAKDFDAARDGAAFRGAGAPPRRRRDRRGRPRLPLRPLAAGEADRGPRVDARLRRRARPSRAPPQPRERRRDARAARAPRARASRRASSTPSPRTRPTGRRRSTSAISCPSRA